MNDTQLSDITSYLTCLLRFPGETADDVLERFYEHYDYTLEFGPMTVLATLIEEQAHNGIALTDRMVRELSGLEVDMKGLDPVAVDLYHRKLLANRKKDIARNAGRRLLAISTGDSDETVDQVMVDVNIADEEKQAAMDLPTHSAVGMKMYRDRAEDLASGRLRVSFPWNVVNEAVPFIYEDDLILLSGQSKYGKSSAAHQIALYNASKINVLYFHNEDNTLKMFLRRIAQYQLARDPDPLASGGPSQVGTLDYRSLLSSNVKQEELMKHVEQENAFVLQKIGDRLTYVYCSGWTAEQIVAEWRRQHRHRKLGLVVIDYLNKIETYSKAKTLGTMASGMEYNVELFKREAGRKGAMTPCLMVQQENEDGTVRDTRSSYIKSQIHLSLVRDVDDTGMQRSGYVKVLRANDGVTGSWPALFYPEYMCWIC